MESIDLTNPTIIFKFNDKEYQIKKANLEQVILFQRKVIELGNQENTDKSEQDLKLITYSVYLLLSQYDHDLLEEEIAKSIRGDIDTVELLKQLGFLNERMVKINTNQNINSQSIDDKKKEN